MEGGRVRDFANESANNPHGYQRYAGYVLQARSPCYAPRLVALLIATPFPLHQALAAVKESDPNKTIAFVEHNGASSSSMMGHWEAWVRLP
jgi:hypothetical protein